MQSAQAVLPQGIYSPPQVIQNLKLSDEKFGVKEGGGGLVYLTNQKKHEFNLKDINLAHL